MAERRMFAKSVVESDAFLDMPASAQALYFHLGMEADDDGFLNNPKRVQRSVGAAGDDFKLLIAKGFVIPFTSGVVVIRHWKVNNYIQSDRRKPTRCIDEMSQLETDESRAYVLSTCTDTECIHDVYRLDTQVSIGKNRLEEGSGAEAPAKKEKKPKETKHKYGEYANVLLTDEDLSKLKAEFPADWQQRIERLSEYMECKGAKYKNHLATIRSWARNEKQGGRGEAQAQAQAAPKWEPVRHEDFEERQRREEQRLKEFKDLKRRGMVFG